MPLNQDPVRLDIASVEKLRELEAALAVQTLKYGHDLKRSSNQVFEHLASLPTDALRHLEHALTNLQHIFKVCSSEQVDVWNDKEFFKISMREMGISYPPDFPDKTKEGYIIEAYDLERRQIFRNMLFMQASSYSLLEVLSFEWPLLYDRASSITDLIISHTEEIIWNANSTVPAKIPPHFIRELRSTTPQVCEVHFECFAPLFSGPNQPSGFVAACSGRVISDIDIGKDNLTFV